MSDFSRDISNFQKYGTYTYSFDGTGNMTFNISSSNFNQVYVAFPLVNVIYNQTKVKVLYDPTFVEFVPPVAETTSSIDLQSDLADAQVQNTELQSQLSDVIASMSITSSNQQAVQQVILELRKSLGQGRVDSDFSSDFPYTPITKPTI